MMKKNQSLVVGGEQLRRGVVGGTWMVGAVAAAVCFALAAQPALAVIDYSQSIAADFTADYPGGDPVAGGPPSNNPFGPNSEWEFHGSNGLASGVIAVAAVPASNQSGWCDSSDGVSCTTGGPWTYFAAQWQPGVTVNPRVGGHGPQEALWTAPASVEEGGISISGSVEQLFETARRMRLQVFKNNSATPSFMVDSLPPIVNGVILQRVNFGPTPIIPVVPGDTLRLSWDGSGAGGNGISTFFAWDVTLTETVPEPASVILLVVGGILIGSARRSKSRS